MLRKSLVVVVVAVCAIVAFTALSRSGQAASSQVYMNQTCTAGKLSVSFNWQGSDATSLQQWIDLSTNDNGWLDGTYISAGPIAGNATSYTWTGLTGSTAHLVRINQQLANGAWDPSGTFYFTTIACVPPTPRINVPVVSKPTILGFADRSLKDLADAVPNGGSVRNCAPSAVYVIVDVPDSRDSFNVRPVWTYNGSVITVPPGTPSLAGGVFSFGGGPSWFAYGIPTTNNNGVARA